MRTAVDAIFVGKERHTEDPSLRERLIGTKVRRDDLSKEVAEGRRHMAPCERQITPEKVERLARLLRDKPLNGSQEP